jgi:uncharacterized membrane protein
LQTIDIFLFIIYSIRSLYNHNNNNNKNWNNNEFVTKKKEILSNVHKQINYLFFHFVRSCEINNKKGAPN